MKNPAVLYTGADEVFLREALKGEQPVGIQKFKGYAASFGLAEGPCTILSIPEDLHKIKEGDILVCKTASPRLSVIMAKLSGLVTEQGGLLSSAAGYAREYKVPAVIGVEGIRKIIRDGDILRVDGTEGTVEIIR